MASAIVQEWMKNQVILNRASTGCLALLPRNHISRSDVICNADVIVPILKFFGMRPAIDNIAAEVEMFFKMGRPAGKPPLKRDQARYL